MALVAGHSAGAVALVAGRSAGTVALVAGRSAGTVALVAGRSAGAVALVVLCRDCVTAPCCLNFPFISRAQRGFIYSAPITHCWLHAASRLRSIKINQGRAVVSGPLAFFNCGYEKLLFFFFHFYLYRYYLTILVVVTVPSL